MTLKQMARAVGIDEESRLRDLFARTALVMFSLDRKDVEDLQRGTPPDHALVARFCYDTADAMMVERKKRLRRKK